MGLDTSHGCWHGGYMGFTLWRNTLAEAAGYELGKMKECPWVDVVLIDWGHVTEENLAGIWESTPEDPLLVLIAHSDCDGEIVVRDTGPLADRIEDLIPVIEGDDGTPRKDWLLEKTRRFVEGLRRASAAGESVEFG